MDRTVRLLSAELANQIAAGEVVERPSSVVKELVENALDAGAKRVTVAIQGGGIDSIVVSDDGHGMDEKNARLALLRHATSKLRAFDDLERLASFGFRGEALPSIASVSDFELETRSEVSEHGIILTREGSEFRSSIVGRPVGTSIKVRRLFENVPARRKFLKSSGTESAQVAEVVLEAALGRPDVSFELIREERSARKYPRTTGRLDRARLVWPDFDLLAFEVTRGPLRLEAFLSKKENAQKGATGLKLIVNGRAVRDRSIAGTIAHAASEHLPRGHYPRGVVYIDLPTTLVDVNVHPQKLEVRFAEPRPLLDALHAAVRRAYERDGRPDAPQQANARFETPEFSPPPSFFPQNSAPAARTPSLTAEKREAVGAYAESVSREPLEREPLRVTTTATDRDETRAPRPNPIPPPPAPRAARASTPARFEFLGRHERGFWIAKSPGGVHFLDPHALAEVALYEELREEVVSGSVRRKPLLFPALARTREPDFERLEGRLELLSAFGFDVRLRSRENVQLLAVPELLASAPSDRLAEALVEYFGSAKCPAEPPLSEVLPRLACLGANPETREASNLLVQFEKSTRANECLHGRVVVAEVFADELERRLVTGSEPG